MSAFRHASSGSDVWELRKLYLTSSYGALVQRSQFAQLEAFCMFLGYARSGTSLLGALLDAHPNVAVAHELDVFKYLQIGFRKHQIFHLLLKNSKTHAKRGRKATGYIYEVQGQWQGRYTTLRVIGDKKGGRSSLRLQKNPELLDDLRTTIGLPLKVFHIVRNPYDNIATKYRRRLQRGSANLRDVIEQHFSQCQTVADTKRKLDAAELLEVHHEVMIKDPVRCLRKMCEFLGIECSEDYVNQCARIVFSSPHKSRRDIEWSQDNIELVRVNMAHYDFLSGYSFET